MHFLNNFKILDIIPFLAISKSLNCEIVYSLWW